MTPQEFIAKWNEDGPCSTLNEEQGAQSHFLDLCELLGVPKPGSVDGYVFEQRAHLIGGKVGYADVYFPGHFAWENKAPGVDLNLALKQLQNYSLALNNPPLLVVCDRDLLCIYTQFTGHPCETHTVKLRRIDDPGVQALLRRVWNDPESFRPKATTRDITEAAAKSFATLADLLRKTGPVREADPTAADAHAERVAHFLTQCVFCFFADDVGLLPDRVFDRLVNNKRIMPAKLSEALTHLFTSMGTGAMFGVEDIPWFNGGLFKTIDVPPLNIMDVVALRNAASLNWTAIDVSIFGTLFERGLDPSKRSQLGAHYTDPATILRIIEPVVQRPLLQAWEQQKPEIEALMAKSKKFGDVQYKKAQVVFVAWLDKLRDYRVLDPACGSGNFLFMGLKALKDIEHQSHLDAEKLGLAREQDLVTGPHNVLGIELNDYAAELARITVWIGELQWRLAHGYAFKLNPVLDPLEHIACRDALVTQDPATGAWTEAQWPTASVVIGNPPFLGGSKKRRELGDAYFEVLDTVFAGRVPGGADLVCYWFDKARHAIETGGLGAAGLVATQSIRSGSNRVVLEAIRNKTRIFDAWSDEAWVNAGAAVRVSLISFGWGECCFLNGERVDCITAELGDSPAVDMTFAKPLAENAGVSFEGAQKNGPFDIAGEFARAWLSRPNVHRKSNALVLRPYLNAADVTGRDSDAWMVDFHGYDLTEAAMFEGPFSHIQQVVKPVRDKKRELYLVRKYWLLKRPAVELRQALTNLDRYIITPRVAKHRFFCFVPVTVLPDSRLNAIARADDMTFGLLSSRLHEAWALANASMHGVGNDPTYNAKSCFETFPFPACLTLEDTAHGQTETLSSGEIIPSGITPNSMRTAAERIARAAKRLNDLRNNWLNPPEWTQTVPEVIPLGMTTSPYPDRILPKTNLSEADAKALQKRTLTNLYNQRPAWLDGLHRELDAAVAAAYGWADYTPEMSDAEILTRLLALNLERAAA